MKTLKWIAVIFTFAVPTLAWSYEHFVCSCQAMGPGVERDVGSTQKFCSYDCNCMGLSGVRPAVMNIPAKVNNVATTAFSLEAWDYKSPICHGQYAWKPSLNAPVWQTQVRFATFLITSEDRLVYPDSIEIAPGLNEQNKPFTSTAPEVVSALKKLLLGDLPDREGAAISRP
jgi:hypothetical protein